MYALKITNGDLAVRGDGAIVQLTGADRIRQDMRLWLLEPIGTDRMYPEFGSDLEGYIGTAITDRALNDVRSEVVRVVGNYMAYEQDKASEYVDSGRVDLASAWDEGDVVSTLSAVTVDAAYDTATVSVAVRTLAGDDVSIDGRL